MEGRSADHSGARCVGDRVSGSVSGDAVSSDAGLAAVEGGDVCSTSPRGLVGLVQRSCRH